MARFAAPFDEQRTRCAALAVVVWPRGSNCVAGGPDGRLKATLKTGRLPDETGAGRSRPLLNKERICPKEAGFSPSASLGIKKPALHGTGTAPKEKESVRVRAGLLALEAE